MASYLDHASLSPLRPEVITTLHEVLDLTQADPGRPYDDALIVRRLVEDSRRAVADLAGVAPRQVIFTSSIAESVATALHGLSGGAGVAAANTERSSTLAQAATVGQHHVIEVDRAGHLDLESLRSVLRANRIDVVCCQVANHETGTMDDVASIIALARAANARVHVDATMALGRLPLDLGALDADAVTVAGELLGGPMGCAALIVRRGSVLPALLLGGAQERGRRAGLENVVGIVGMGVAASVLGEPGVMAAEADLARSQIAQLEIAALSVDRVDVLGEPDPDLRAPHVRCFSIGGVEAEPVLMGLNRAGIAVHSGSACASEAFEPSPVLAAMGLEADRSMRVSVGWSTVQADVDRFADHFESVVEDLRRLGHSTS